MHPAMKNEWRRKNNILFCNNTYIIIVDTRISVLRTSFVCPSWILKLDGLESSVQRPISSIGKTNLLAFFPRVIFSSSKFQFFEKWIFGEKIWLLRFLLFGCFLLHLFFRIFLFLGFFFYFIRFFNFFGCFWMFFFLLFWIFFKII